MKHKKFYLSLYITLLSSLACHPSEKQEVFNTQTVRDLLKTHLTKVATSLENETVALSAHPSLSRFFNGRFNDSPSLGEPIKIDEKTSLFSKIVQNALESDFAKALFSNEYLINSTNNTLTYKLPASLCIKAPLPAQEICNHLFSSGEFTLEIQQAINNTYRLTLLNQTRLVVSVAVNDPSFSTFTSLENVVSFSELFSIAKSFSSQSGMGKQFLSQFSSLSGEVKVLVKFSKNGGLSGCKNNERLCVYSYALSDFSLETKMDKLVLPRSGSAEPDLHFSSDDKKGLYLEVHGQPAHGLLGGLNFNTDAFSLTANAAKGSSAVTVHNLNLGNKSLQLSGEGMEITLDINKDQERTIQEAQLSFLAGEEHSQLLTQISPVEFSIHSKNSNMPECSTEESLEVVVLPSNELNLSELLFNLTKAMHNLNDSAKANTEKASSGFEESGEKDENCPVELLLVFKQLFSETKESSQCNDNSVFTLNKGLFSLSYEGSVNNYHVTKNVTVNAGQCLMNH